MKSAKIKLKCNPRVLKEAVHWYRQEVQSELREETGDWVFWRKGNSEKVALHDELLEIERQLEDLLRND